MHDLIVWIQEVAVPKLGWFGMFLVAFADSSFVSLPEVNDLLIVTGAAREVGLPWRYVFATALGSVLGCLALYEVGRRGGERFALRFVSRRRLVWAEEQLGKWGWLALAIPAISPPPMPFKGFVLAAGVFAMPRGPFMATIFIARSVRYTFWAILGATYGEEAVEWLKSFDLWLQANSSALASIAAVGVVGLFTLWRVRRRRVANIVEAAPAAD